MFAKQLYVEQVFAKHPFGYRPTKIGGVGHTRY